VGSEFPRITLYGGNQCVIFLFLFLILYTFRRIGNPRFPLLRAVERLCGLGQSLLWGNAAQGHVGAIILNGDSRQEWGALNPLFY
jgi:hypothetical protein